MTDGTYTTELKNLYSLAQLAIHSKKAGSTYTELAKQIGISSSLVSAIDHGFLNVSVATLIKVFNWAYPAVPVPAPTPTPIPPPPPIHPPDSDIRSILEMPGGQSVRLSGDYKGGGSGVFPHDRPLVLYADAPGEVGLDLSAAGLLLDVGSSNIVLCGIKSYNGMIVSRCQDFTVFYHEATFPIEVWHAMYLRQLGMADDSQATEQQKKDAIQRMAQPVCKGIWIGQFDNGIGPTLMRNRILGSDIHDCGDDGAFFDKSDSPVCQGTRIWNIQEKQGDPGVNPWRPNSDMFHPDAYQIPGGVKNGVLADSYLQQACNIGGDNADLTLALRNLWVAGCDGSGFDLISQNGLHVYVTVQNVVGFGNGVQYPHDDGWNTFMTQFLDGIQCVRWGSNAITSIPRDAVGIGHYDVPGRLEIKDLGGNSDRVIPPQFRKASWDNTGMYLEDRLAPLNDPQNPALLWRKANPYASWRQFVGA